MITSDTKGGRFVIATPTKCGTTTLEELARRHRGGRAGKPLNSFRIMDWESPRRQHRMALPSHLVRGYWGTADRYMMVRNPWARYVSQYHYLKNPTNYSKTMAKEIQGREWGGKHTGRAWFDEDPLSFGEFLELVAEFRKVYSNKRWTKRRGELTDPAFYRSPWVWLDSQVDSLTYLGKQPGSELGQGVRVLRLENIWGELRTLKERYGLDALYLKESIHANRTLTYGEGKGKPGGLGGYEPWRAYYGLEFNMCSESFNSVAFGTCTYAGYWVAGACPACQVGIAKEAVQLGYAGGLGV
jgi:hypothetical protein